MTDYGGDHDNLHTYDNSTHERVIKDPPSSNIGDAYSTVMITHITEHCQEGLKEGPCPPRPQDHIEILNEGTGLT